MSQKTSPGLKSNNRCADTGKVHIARLVIETDQSMVSLELHPRLTVVAGVDRAVRDLLATELIGGLASTRSGVHLEMVTQDRRRLTVFRPSGASHRIVDTGTGDDHSDEFRDEAGRLNVFGHFEIEAGRAADEMYLNRARLAPASEQDATIARLAELDQGHLWAAAARVRVTDEAVQSVSESIHTSAENAEVVAKVEQRHQSLESAVAQQQMVHHNVRLVTAFSLLVTATALVLGLDLVVPLAGVSAALVLFMFAHQVRVSRAQRSENLALKDAGAESYLGFVAKRVDNMMSGTEQQRRLSAVAEDHRTAAIAWTRLAGNVPVEWAFAHHDEIDATSQLRRQLRSLGHASSTPQELDSDSTALAHALIVTMGRLRKLGKGSEGMPLILDDPFVDIDDSMRPTLLDLVARSAGNPQVILLTSSPDVADWARLEALTGELALVEPQASPAPSQAHMAG